MTWMIWHYKTKTVSNLSGGSRFEVAQISVEDLLFDQLQEIFVARLPRTVELLTHFQQSLRGKEGKGVMRKRTRG